MRRTAYRLLFLNSLDYKCTHCRERHRYAATVPRNGNLQVVVQTSVLTLQPTNQFKNIWVCMLKEALHDSTRKYRQNYWPRHRPSQTVIIIRTTEPNESSPRQVVPVLN